MTTNGFRKITVAGHITLGTQHELVQGPRAGSGIGDLFATRGSGPEIERDARKRERDSAVGEMLEFRLSGSPIADLRISDAGLVTSFGIFGAPGSGKTVLLMHMLQQLLAHSKDDPDRRYGALILDPKAALIDDVIKAAARAGRLQDLVVINTQRLNAPGVSPVNVIDSGLDPYELGAILVLAGRSAGIDASDPFWFQEWTNLFAATLSILRLHAQLNPTAFGARPVTLRRLLDAIFEEEDPDPDRGYPRERTIQRIARGMAGRIGELHNCQHDLLIDLQQLERFYRQDYVGTIEAFVTKAFGMFRRSRLACYSDDSPRLHATGFYEDIVEKGHIVLVSISPSEPALAKTLCTLVKCLFQRTVLARRDLLASKAITNAIRPLVIACDEYSEIASEVPGQSMGDGQFLALAREYGCMALLATQSVNVLEASSLKEAWKSVFSNFAAKIYMRLVDNETAEEATKLAGESDWKVLSRGSSLGKDGRSTSSNRELRERKNLPSTVLTHVLTRGQAVVIGSLDGGTTLPGTYFLQVPKPLVSTEAPEKGPAPQVPCATVVAAAGG